MPSNVGAVKVTEACPLLNGREVPWFVAVPIVGGNGADLLCDSTTPGFLGLMFVIVP